MSCQCKVVVGFRSDQRGLVGGAWATESAVWTHLDCAGLLHTSWHNYGEGESLQKCEDQSCPASLSHQTIPSFEPTVYQSLCQL